MENAPCCYICLEGGDVMSPGPCMCRGSLSIHRACLQKVQQSTMSCGVCKARYSVVCDGSHRETVGSKHIVYYTVNGKRHGMYEEFDEDGDLLKRAYYYDGLLEGPYYVYHQDGESVMIECTYIAGKKEGEFYEFDEDANLISRRHYRNGVCDGLCQEYYDGTGERLFQEYRMLEGVRDGLFKEWAEDGRLVYQCIYDDGVKISEEFF